MSRKYLLLCPAYWTQWEQHGELRSPCNSGVRAFGPIKQLGDSDSSYIALQYRHSKCYPLSLHRTQNYHRLIYGYWARQRSTASSSTSSTSLPSPSIPASSSFTCSSFTTSLHLLCILHLLVLFFLYFFFFYVFLFFFFFFFFYFFYILFFYFGHFTLYFILLPHLLLLLHLSLLLLRSLKLCRRGDFVRCYVVVWTQNYVEKPYSQWYSHKKLNLYFMVL